MFPFLKLDHTLPYLTQFRASPASSILGWGPPARNLLFLAPLNSFFSHSFSLFLSSLRRFYPLLSISVEQVAAACFIISFLMYIGTANLSYNDSLLTHGMIYPIYCWRQRTCPFVNLLRQYRCNIPCTSGEIYTRDSIILLWQQLNNGGFLDIYGTV